MKVVTVTFNKGKVYLFEYAPKYSFETLEKGDFVLVETSRGEVTGICEDNSFEIDGTGLEVLAKCIGAKLPLNKVVGKYKLERYFEENRND